MSKLFKLIVALTFMMVVQVDVYAAHYYRNVTIKGAGIYSSGGKRILLIDITGNKSGMAGCATTKRLALSDNSPHYEEMVAIALAAYTSKDTQVDVYVTETCNHWGNAEDILGIKMGAMPW